MHWSSSTLLLLFFIHGEGIKLSEVPLSLFDLGEGSFWTQLIEQGIHALIIQPKAWVL